MTGSEFKFFQLVEDTIEGVVTFVDRFLCTSLNLVFLPHRFPKKWLDESTRNAFVKPFTMTAISVFALYLLFVSFVRSELVKRYTPGFTDVPADLSHYMAMPRLFAYSIPTIILLYALARLLSRLTASSEASRSNLASLALYACSLQCLTLALHMFFKPVFGNLGVAVPLYGFLGSALMLRNAITDGKDSTTRRPMCSSLVYAVFSSGCPIAVLLVGVAIELLPAYEKYTAQKSREETEAELKPLIEHVLDQVDPDRTRRENITLALRDIRVHKGRTGFTCLAIITNGTQQPVHLGLADVRCHLRGAKQELAPGARTSPQAASILIVAPTETQVTELTFSNPMGESVVHGEELVFQVLVEVFAHSGADWNDKRVEFGDYKFRVVGDSVRPVLISTQGKRVGEQKFATPPPPTGAGQRETAYEPSNASPSSRP